MRGCKGKHTQTNWVIQFLLRCVFSSKPHYSHRVGFFQVFAEIQVARYLHLSSSEWQSLQLGHPHFRDKPVRDCKRMWVWMFSISKSKNKHHSCKGERNELDTHYSQEENTTTNNEIKWNDLEDLNACAKQIQNRIPTSNFRAISSSPKVLPFFWAISAFNQHPKWAAFSWTPNGALSISFCAVSTSPGRGL